MQKKVYKRLNDNTVLCISKYDNRLGFRYHSIVIHFEDTKQNVEFGTYRINKCIIPNYVADDYSYNNDYVIGYKYNSEKDWLKIDRIYDINNRCDVLTDDKFYNFFKCVDIDEKIKKQKYKTLTLGKNYKKNK